MQQYKLSICIPARNEMFLARTVQDILENKEDATEIIVGLDGQWANPPIPQHPDVNIIYVPESIGQRGITKMCARLSKAKYIMKADSHCSFDKGFDRKMLEGFEKTGDNVTMVPIMRNLHAFDWKCHRCGWTKYQGPTPKICPDCNTSDKIRHKMRWIGKHNPQSTSFSFDTRPHFQYFEDYKHREPYITDKKTGFTETMSLQGSCFMMTREKYFDLNIDDESLGSWGNQGISVACKTWLSGGKVIVNHSTWYAHMFRTQGGDFGFPWLNKGRDTQRTKANVRKQIWLGRLPHQKYPISWLIERFMPVNGWTIEDIAKLDKK